MSRGNRANHQRTTVVIDDHPMVADIVTKVVDNIDGFSVVGWAPTASKGFAEVLKHHPDFVVIDYVLPDGTGADLARRILRAAPDTKLVMFSGSYDPRALVDSLDAGCHAFVEKKNAASELVRVLEAVATGVSDFPSELMMELPRLEELVVHYQPIVDLGSEAMVGAEALVRWNHRVRGLVGPDEFVARAEETGLIIALGGRVLADACKQATAWRSTLPDASGMSISVNVSALQLATSNLVEFVEDALHAARLPADGLVIELTETGVMDGDPHTAESLRALQAIGVELHVDDFGTGYSSLVNLRRFPIAALKVDRSFVGGMLRHSEDLEIVAATIRLAHSLGLRSVAEGVEHEAQAIQLRDLGCDLAQGYLWSRAVEADEFAAWHTSRTLAPLHKTTGAEPLRQDRGPENGASQKKFEYAHCGWCHRKGAYLVPGRPILRCRFCQAVMSVPPALRSKVERELTTYSRDLRGLRTARRETTTSCRRCGGPPAS